jgi:hypothetical protein
MARAYTLSLNKARESHPEEVQHSGLKCNKRQKSCTLLEANLSKELNIIMCGDNKGLIRNAKKGTCRKLRHHQVFNIGLFLEYDKASLPYNGKYFG